MAADNDAKTRARETYNAAADRYDDPVNSFWDRFGRATVVRLELRPGMRVLDVCCGSGASALPAAAAVGSSGSVLGVDLAENLLELGRAKAAERSLSNIEFRTGDMLDLGLDEGMFDAVVCVFGIFFVPDPVDAARRLWRLVRRGGVLAMTTWGEGLFEPGNSLFWETIRGARPELYKGFNPWDQLGTARALRELFERAGAENTTVDMEQAWQELRQPSDWWSIVLGTGYRGTIEKLSDAERRRVEEENLSLIEARGVTRVRTDVLYGAARRA
jgi:ubiquinone/menaquinone biosynthesis C-methylase UbiE